MQLALHGQTRVRGSVLALEPFGGAWSVTACGTSGACHFTYGEIASGGSEGFLYDGQLRPVAWLNGAGQVYARFVYGLHANVPEYMVVGATTYRFLTDHLGSVRLVVNASTGAVVQRIDYDEWGQVLADSNPGFQPFGFAGGLYDRDTGLVRFGARDYDPSTGRWTANDPAGFEGGLNFYEYCAGDPINFMDETGLSWGSAIGNFGLGLGEGIVGSIVVAALVATGPVGAVIAVGLVAYGSYAMATNLYAAAIGEDPYTGRKICDEQRINMAARGAGQLLGGLIGGEGFQSGREFEVPGLLGRGPTGKPGRIAPWGNRTGNEWGEFPHYHRAIPDPAKPGNSLPGQGLRNHRPWEGGL